MRVPSDDITTQLDLGTQGGRGSEMRAYVLVRIAGRADVFAVEEGATIVVGRGSEAEVNVDDGRVSRKHTELTLRGGRLVVRDLGSRNGTRVGDAVIHGSERVANRGDEIVVGPARITIVSLPGPAATPAKVPSRGAPADEEPIVLDDAMRQVFAVVSRLAQVPTTVLIRGETGVGKELVAQALHRQSPRASRSFFCLNCAAVPESLLEGELFGHEKGAFTGAGERRRGILEAADGGTLFLDEIGDLPPPMQVKLLRVLETKRFLRVGGTTEIVVDVRVVCATHRDLDAMVQTGAFRNDLYYRLAGFTVDVPPLRDRTSELRPLAEHFARRFCAQIGRAAPILTPRALTALEAHPWPGNVRELRNAIEHAVVLAEGAPIEAEHLPATLRDAASRPPDSGDPSMRSHLDQAERMAIERALATADGHRGRAAELLGVSKRTLQYRLAKYGMKD